VLALRAGIVLDCASGLNNLAVAHRRRVSKQMVSKSRERFVCRRVAGLLDEPRCGTPRKIEDGQVESVIVRTLESTPRDATHWSTRSMAEASGLSHMTMQRIWKAFGLEPHRSETFKLSTDPQLVEKMRDIVGL
jgi:transposase